MVITVGERVNGMLINAVESVIARTQTPPAKRSVAEGVARRPQPSFGGIDLYRIILVDKELDPSFTQLADGIVKQARRDKLYPAKTFLKTLVMAPPRPNDTLADVVVVSGHHDDRLFEKRLNRTDEQVKRAMEQGLDTDPNQLFAALVREKTAFDRRFEVALFKDRVQVPSKKLQPSMVPPMLFHIGGDFERDTPFTLAEHVYHFFRHLLPH